MESITGNGINKNNTELKFKSNSIPRDIIYENQQSWLRFQSALKKTKKISIEINRILDSNNVIYNKKIIVDMFMDFIKDEISEAYKASEYINEHTGSYLKLKHLPTNFEEYLKTRGL